MIRVLVVDDNEGVRELVGRSLALEPDIAIVGTASDGSSGLRLAYELKPDVMVLDLSMPHMDGLEVLQLLRPVRPDISVVVYSGEDALRDAALAGGASEFVAKGTPRDELVRAIRVASVTKPVRASQSSADSMERAG